MSVLERLKSLVNGAKKDLNDFSDEEKRNRENGGSSKQTSSEDEIERIKSFRNNVTSDKEESKVVIPVKEEEESDVISSIHNEESDELEIVDEIPEIKPIVVDSKKESDNDKISQKSISEESNGDSVEIEKISEESLEEKSDIDSNNEISVDEQSDVNDELILEDNISDEDNNASDEEESDSLEDDESLEEENDSEENKESDSMTLLKENDIYSMDDIDKEFTQKFIDAGLDTVDHCFQCGTCGGGCPSGRRTPYKVRQIVRKCLLGLKEEVISDPALWMCTTCYTCQERCPRSVEIVEIIKMARNQAAQAGYMADAHKATGSFVIKTGHGVPINDATKTLRKNIGLDELPPSVHSFPDQLKEVQNICEACGFDKLIGYNMETGELE